MPPALSKAHADLDRAVERCYRPEPFHSDRERVEHLFRLYEQLTAPLLPASPRTHPRPARGSAVFRTALSHARKRMDRYKTMSTTCTSTKKARKSRMVNVSLLRGTFSTEADFDALLHQPGLR